LKLLFLGNYLFGNERATLILFYLFYFIIVVLWKQVIISSVCT